MLSCNTYGYVCNTPRYCDVDYFVPRSHERKEKSITLRIGSNDLPNRSNEVEVDEHCLLRLFPSFVVETRVNEKERKVRYAQNSEWSSLWIWRRNFSCLILRFFALILYSTEASQRTCHHFTDREVACCRHSRSLLCAVTIKIWSFTWIWVDE